MRYITAKQIFSGKKFLSPNTVLVLNDKNIIHGISTTDVIDNNSIEHYEGIITPGFVNVHCHLELSHLHQIISEKTGIVDFGLNVIKHRNNLAVEHQIEAMKIADKQMIEQGIVAVGDISNSEISVEAKKTSRLYYHTFVELISLNPEKQNLVFEKGKEIMRLFENENLSCSLAPHAPYSVSNQLIKSISDFCFLINKSTSIHNQESDVENLFFENKTGDYLRLYETLQLNIDFFEASGKSSLLSILKHLNTNVNTLLVHNSFTNKVDIENANAHHQKLFWCLCPNANLYIENVLPDIELLINQNCCLTLGTDSLASNNQLSIIDEINTIYKHYPKIPFDVLLKAATYNGASFLGIQEKFGELKPNSSCGVNLIEGNVGEYKVKKLA
jgi:cytosine/adenosine deaminase-related metal-dependent hydrolase